MLPALKQRFAAFMEAAFERSLNKFYKRRDDYFINNNAISQATLRQIYMDYRNRVADGKPLPTYREAGFSVYSQYDEDGIILYIMGIVGFKAYKFVDIGSGNCLYASNTANLATNFGHHGLFIDIRERFLEQGRQYYINNMATGIYPPKFACAAVDKDNINDVIKNQGFEGEVDILSIDIDGNDYYIWEALDIIKPRLCIIENHVEFGMNSVVVPYDPTYKTYEQHQFYNGASPVAFNKLAKRKGYHLVATNIFGFNTFYLRDDLATPYLPEIPVEKVLEHERNRERVKVYDELVAKGFKFNVVE